MQTKDTLSDPRVQSSRTSSFFLVLGNRVGAASEGGWGAATSRAQGLPLVMPLLGLAAGNTGVCVLASWSGVIGALLCVPAIF